jgi:hypothetical protein
MPSEKVAESDPKNKLLGSEKVKISNDKESDSGGGYTSVEQTI